MKLKKNSITILYIITLFIFYPLSAFSSYTLNDCLKIAKENSPQAKIARSSRKSLQSTYKSFSADYLPQVSMVSSLPGLDRSIIQTQISSTDTPLFYSQSTLNSSLNLNINQKIAITGADFSISSGLSRRDNFGDSKYFSWSASPIQIRLNQPLFQVNNLAWNKEIADLRAESYDKQYIESMEDIATDVTDKFFNLYIAGMNIENAKFNVQVNDTLFTLSKGRFLVGKIAENDLLQSELALMNSRNDLDEAILEYKRTMEELRAVLGISFPGEIIIIPPLSIPNINLDPEKAYNEALKNRSDIIDYKAQELEAERNVESAKSKNRFNASITASYGLNQTANNVPDIYKKPLDQESFNINLSIPLYQWGKGNAEIETSLYEQKKVENSLIIQKQTFELNVKYTAQRFTQLQKKVELSAKADTVAKRRFEVAKNRYLIGKIDLNTFFIAQNEKDNAAKSFIQTVKDYWVTYYRLRRMTLYDFDKNREINYE